jgi:hypothetical protein
MALDQIDKIIGIGLAACTFLGAYKLTLDHLYPKKKKKATPEEEEDLHHTKNKCDQLEIRLNDLEAIRSKRYKEIEERLSWIEQRQEALIKIARANRERIKALARRYFEKYS